MEDYELIEEYILKLSEKYPKLDFNYDDIDGEFNITHSDPRDNGYDLEDFYEYANGLAQDMLFGNDIYNFFVEAI